MSRDLDNSAHWLRELTDRLGERHPIVLQWKTDMAQRIFLDNGEPLAAAPLAVILPPPERRSRFGIRSRKLLRDERRGAVARLAAPQMA